MSVSGITSSAAQMFDAAQAYGRASQTTQFNPVNSNNISDSTQDADAVNSFSQVLSNAVHGAITTGKVAEQQTAAALSGKGNMADVVSSVEEAKVTLQTVTALRDRFVSAYQDVMRMSI